MKIKYFIITLIFVFIGYNAVFAEPIDDTGIIYLDHGNDAIILNNMEYLSGESLPIALPNVYPVQIGKYATVGRIGSSFSGSSISASGDNQSPSVEMSFSDKSSVSGYISNFMKSFNYISGISP